MASGNSITSSLPSLSVTAISSSIGTNRLSVSSSSSSESSITVCENSGALQNSIAAKLKILMLFIMIIF